MPSVGPGTGTRLWTPLDAPFADSIVLWLDGADTSTYPAGTVTTWVDKSRFHNNGTSGASITSGTRRINGVCGLDFARNAGVITVDGVSDHPKNRYYWCVYQPDDTFVNGETVFWSTGTDGDDWRLGAKDSGKQGEQDLLESGVAHHIPSGQTVRSTASPAMMGMQYTPSALTPFLNGTPGAALSHSFTFSSAGTQHKIGYNGSTDYTLWGILGELIVVDLNMSPHHRRLLDLYGAAKWRIGVNPAACSPPVVFA